MKIPKGGTKERESVARGGIRDNLGGRDENQVGSGRNRQEKSRVKFLGFDKEGRTILETVLIKKRKEKKKTIDLGNELVD